MLEGSDAAEDYETVMGKECEDSCAAGLATTIGLSSKGFSLNPYGQLHNEGPFIQTDPRPNRVDAFLIEYQRVYSIVVADQGHTDVECVGEQTEQCVEHVHVQCGQQRPTRSQSHHRKEALEWSPS